MDANGFLADFTTVGAAAVARIYDQTGGDDLVQLVTDRQPLLVKNVTPSGKAAIKGDGVNDFMIGESVGTTRPYMVARPMGVWMGGAGYGGITHGNYANVWNIPHQDGLNNSPYKRFGINWANSNGSDLAVIECRTGGATNTADTRMISSRTNWGSLTFSSAAGRLVEGGFPGVSRVAPGVAASYPNPTALRIFSNGMGTENWGGYFCELTLFDAPGLTESDINSDVSVMVDRASTGPLFGNNRLMGIVATKSFDGGSSKSVAELKLFETGSTINVAAAPLQTAALNFYNNSENAEKAFDNNPATLWSTTSGAGWTPLLALLPAPATVTSGIVVGRSDSYYSTNVSQFYFTYLDRNGWHNLPGTLVEDRIDFTTIGNAPGRSFGWDITGGAWLNPPAP